MVGSDRFTGAGILCGSRIDRWCEAYCERQPDHRSVYGDHLFCICNYSGILQHYTDTDGDQDDRSRSVYTEGNYRRCSRQYVCSDAERCGKRYFL